MTPTTASPAHSSASSITDDVAVTSNVDIHDAFTSLDLEMVARHFDPDKVDVEPLVVCEGISVDAFNAYFDDRDEDVPVALRFVDLDCDGRVIIIEWPTPVHEITIEQFKSEFLSASGNRDEIAKRGSFTAHRLGHRNKQGDATFGPKNNTPNRAQVPAGLTVDEWVTFAVEVGRWQTWAELLIAAQWWSSYIGIEYILLLKVSARGRSIGYRLFHITALGVMPAAPVAQGSFLRSNAAPAVISLSARRILAIPGHQALPAGVNANIVINLRHVMQQVIESLH